MRHLRAQTAPVHEDMILGEERKWMERLKCNWQARERLSESMQEIRAACPSVQQLAKWQRLQVCSSDVTTAPAFPKVRTFHQTVTDGVRLAAKVACGLISLPACLKALLVKKIPFKESLEQVPGQVLATY